MVDQINRLKKHLKQMQILFQKKKKVKRPPRIGILFYNLIFDICPLNQKRRREEILLNYWLSKY